MTDRRSFLSKLGAGAGLSALSGLAGCALLSKSDPLTVGYSTRFGTLQGPIMARKGYLDELDVSVETMNDRETSGTVWDNLTAGTVEVALGGLDQAVSRYGHHDSLRVVAANNVDDIALLVRPELAELWTEHGQDAFAEFERQTGEVAAIGGMGRWTSRWLDEVGVPTDRVESVVSGGPQFIANWIADERMDGAFVDAPTPAELAQLDVSLEMIGWIGDAVSPKPGGVTAMTEELWKDEPALAKRILEKHVAATEFLTEQPEAAATIVGEAFGDRLSTETARMALQHRTANFVTDPRPIVEPTNVYVESRVEAGLLDESYPAEELFEPSLYTDVA